MNRTHRFRFVVLALALVVNCQNVLAEEHPQSQTVGQNLASQSGTEEKLRFSALQSLTILPSDPDASSPQPVEPNGNAPTTKTATVGHFFQESGGEGQSRQQRLIKQRQEKAKNLSPYKISDGERKMRNFEVRKPFQRIFVKGWHGIRPLIGGMPSGSGFVGGVGYVNGLTRDSFQFAINGRYSTRNFKDAELLAEFPTFRSGSPFRGFFEAKYYDYPGIGFYGIGTDSDKDDQSFFGITNSRINGGVTYTPNRHLSIGGGVGYIKPDIDDGNRDPNIDEVFDVTQLPGYFVQPDFLTYRGYVEFGYVSEQLPRIGVSLALIGERFEDQDDLGFDFNRFIADLKGEVPLGYRNRRLAFRFRTSHSNADSGNQVPFYLLETLGGATTIRGYQEYRFRDRRNMLLNLEYRWEVWTYLDFALFGDFGKVFSDSDDFDFNDLSAGYGIGFRVHTPTGVNFRIDFAYSDEKFAIHIGSGPAFFGLFHLPKWIYQL